MDDNITRAWKQFLNESRLVDPGLAVLEDVVEAYQEPHRHYHNLQHVHDCLELLEIVSTDVHDRTAIRAAIWFHDIIYDPRSKENEMRSAEIARKFLTGMGAANHFLETTGTLILDTRHNSVPASEPGKYMVDIDLAILGADEPVFDAYERAIRAEYQYVSDETFRAGRARILEHFGARSPLYHTQLFQDRFEAAARRNLARSIERLKQPPHDGTTSTNA
jgi:predicted metal-dependent HD superfamily phosphohydrolase